MDIDEDEEFMMPQIRQPPECTFTLDRANGVYYVGETIKGKVSYTLTKKEEITDLTLGLYGKVVVQLFEKNGVIYDSSETGEDLEYYMSQDNCCFMIFTLDSNKTLEPGTKTYEFSIDLGPKCVSSFEGTYGQIRYELKFTKNRYERNTRYIYPVTVLRKEVLKDDKSNLNNLSAITQISTSLSSSLIGRANLKLKTLYSDYVPGQIIEYDMDVHKSKLERLSNFRVVLIRKTKYTCIYPSLKEVTEETELSESICGDEDSSFFVRSGQLSIPSTPPSIYTDFIATEYILRAEVKVTLCCSSYIRTELKVKIVTTPVPSRLSRNQYEHHSAGVPPVISVDCKIPYPPTYTKGFFNGKRFVDREVSADERFTNWMPSYPVYTSKRDFYLDE